MRDCHLVARTCGNEVGVAISIRDPYTSPFTSRCKFARCLLLVRCLCSETVAIGFLSSVEPNSVESSEILEVSKRRHNFGMKRFKEKSLFIFHARIALKSLILLFVRLIARGARIGKTHTHTHTDRQTDRTSTVTLAHAPEGYSTWSVCLSVCLSVCVCVCVCVFSLFWHLAQSGVQTAVSATSARYGHEI